MNERIIWIQEERKDSGEGTNSGTYTQEKIDHDAVLQALLEAGLEITISEDLRDLRLLLTGGDPILLLAELERADEWEGWRLVTELRDQGMDLPVLVMSGAGSGEDAVAAFKAGANDYLSRPIHTGELTCRILNLLILSGRRRKNHLLKIDGLILDPSSRHVNRDGNQLKLTGKEFDLLYYLAVHAGQICPRTEILQQVWGYNFEADTNVVDVYIRHIRLKVDKGYRNKLIHTIRGTGYVMRASHGDATC
ncbi:response regulator [Paenibacillus agri]|uniref:Response regulator transcription factor n=1 Tax=Paenibacillus agri TaxID=2744309 RepID=A0A850ETH6_9BACL|nr:response regulator transcription factor [Paenibacillus agri]NUU62807.1 response regulator transcription factor [Paenibacillus agri]